MFKRFIWLIMLIPLQATGQDTDHPATSLARMQEAFRGSLKTGLQADDLLMDSMITMETAIDHKVRPRLLKTYSDYALLFGKARKGRLYITCTCTPGFPKAGILTA